MAAVASAPHVVSEDPDGLTSKTADMMETQRLIDMLKMRLFLINSQAATTRGQIVVMEDTLRRECVRKRSVDRSGQQLRSASRVTPLRTTLVPVRRRSKRAFEARIIAKKKVKRVDDDRRCSVCLETIGDDDSTKTECAHTFHRQCIDRWAAERFDDPTCPECRSQLFVPT
jgi:hypothetical protein